MGLAGAGLFHQVECTLGFHMIVSYEESEDTVAAVAVRRFKAYRHASFFPIDDIIDPMYMIQ